MDNSKNVPISVENVYWEPFREGDIEYTHDSDEERARFLDGIIQKNIAIVDSIREKHGSLGTRPVELAPSDAERLAGMIKVDNGWKGCLEETMDRLAPDILKGKGMETIINAIYLPWFVEKVTAMTGNEYLADMHKMKIDFSQTHSYISLLARAGFDVGVQLPSVSNIMICSNDTIMCGWRGGRNYSNTIMTLPAGSVKAKQSSDYIFACLDDELNEELRIEGAMVAEKMLVGKVSGPFIPMQPHFVTATNILYDAEGLVSRWRRSVDRKEHRLLYALPTGREEILDEMIAYNYRVDKEDKEIRARTTMDNVGRFLPQCSSSVLAYLGYECKNPLWLEGACSRMGFGMGSRVEEDLRIIPKR